MQFDPTMEQIRFDSPLGTMCLAASSQGLVGAWFFDQRHRPDGMQGTDAWPTRARHPVLRAAAAQLDAYFARPRSGFELPLDLRHGTPFQQAVWRALLEISAGRTASYGALGRQIGKPGAARAIGAAVGRNTLSIIVPCHRIVGADGSLTGYAGGLQRKTALLQLEGVL